MELPESGNNCGIPENEAYPPVGILVGPVIFLEGDPQPTAEYFPTGPVEGPLQFVEDQEESTLEGASKVAMRSSLSRFLLVLLVGALLVSCALLLIAQAADSFYRLSSVSTFLAWGFLAALSLAATAVAMLAYGSWRAYRRLREVTKIRQLAAKIGDASLHRSCDEEQLRREIEVYLTELEGQDRSEMSGKINELRGCYALYAAEAERDIEELERYVLRPLDRKVDEIIDTRAVQVALATALASHSFDMLIVLWQSLTLVNQLSQLYAGRPGMWGTLRLLRRGMTLVVFAEIADLAVQAGSALLLQKPAVVLGGRVTEGMANGLLMIRLGEAVRKECRPVPAANPDRNPVICLMEAIARYCVIPANNS